MGLSKEEQNLITTKWGAFKEREKVRFNLMNIDDNLHEWHKYRNKILNDSFTLDDYTNTLRNITATMPGGYLCNFLERTTRTVFGSSNPGNANYFEVKLNNDKKTYYIKSQDKGKASKIEAELYFDKNIKVIFKSIVSESDLSKKIELVENAESIYSAKQILRKVAVLDSLTDFLCIYSSDVLKRLYVKFKFIDTQEKEVLAKSHRLYKYAKEVLQLDEKNKVELILMSHFLWEYSQPDK